MSTLQDYDDLIEAQTDLDCRIHFDHEPIIRFTLIKENCEHDCHNILTSHFDEEELAYLLSFSEKSNRPIPPDTDQHTFVLKVDNGVNNPLYKYAIRLGYIEQDEEEDVISADLKDASVDATGHPILATIMACGFA
jgi:hypothetical protein